MAYCGTVTIHDEDGEALHTIRYGCMPQGDVIGLRDRLAADVLTLRSKKPPLKLELLCDGAPEMWNLLEGGFTPSKFGKDVHQLVDLHHRLPPLTWIVEHDVGRREGLRIERAPHPLE
jgi:hypothetical protein